MIELPNQVSWLLSAFYITLIEGGVRENEVYAQFGMNLEQLGKMTSPVSIEQFKHLGEIAQTLTNRPDIGLILGKDAEHDENKGGLVINYALNSPTIRLFLRELEKVSDLFRDILSFNLKEKRDTCEILIDFYKAGDMGLPLVEFYLSGFISTLRQVIGCEFNPIKIGFQYPPPLHIKKYHQAFKTKLVFNQDITSIVFDKKYLDMPTPKPVAIVKEALSEVVDSQLKRLNAVALFQTRIRELIAKRLPSGKVGVEAIAKDLKSSRGAIYRKLKEENTSYKQLLTLTRKKLAKQYLLNSSLNIDEIASKLGYSESSAFKRAFKNWFGVNPGQYRKKANR